MAMRITKKGKTFKLSIEQLSNAIKDVLQQEIEADMDGAHACMSTGVEINELAEEVGELLNRKKNIIATTEKIKIALELLSLHSQDDKYFYLTIHNPGILVNYGVDEAKTK